MVEVNGDCFLAELQNWRRGIHWYLLLKIEEFGNKLVTKDLVHLFF